MEIREDLLEGIGCKDELRRSPRHGESSVGEYGGKAGNTVESGGRKRTRLILRFCGREERKLCPHLSRGNSVDAAVSDNK